jgi:tetratricopeptide (TPR) repeat protein
VPAEDFEVLIRTLPREIHGSGPYVVINDMERRSPGCAATSVQCITELAPHNVRALAQQRCRHPLLKLVVHLAREIVIAVVEREHEECTMIRRRKTIAHAPKRGARAEVVSARQTTPELREPRRLQALIRSILPPLVLNEGVHRLGGGVNLRFHVVIGNADKPIQAAVRLPQRCRALQVIEDGLHLGNDDPVNRPQPFLPAERDEHFRDGRPRTRKARQWIVGIGWRDLVLRGFWRQSVTAGKVLAERYRTMQKGRSSVKAQSKRQNTSRFHESKMPLPAELAKLLETLADAAEYRVGVKRDDQLDRYRSKYDLPLPRQSQTLLAAYIRVIARHARSGGEMLRGTYAEMLRYLEYLGGAAPRFSRRKEQGHPANIVPYDQELIRNGITDLAAFAARAARIDEGRIPFPGGWWRLHAETVTQGNGVARIWLAVCDANAHEYLSDTPPAAWIPLPVNASGAEEERPDERDRDASETPHAEARSELADSGASVWPDRLRELPTPAIDFVGRSKQIAELYDHLIARGTVPVAAISGMPGVGKSELAITVAHLPALVDRFRRYVVFYQFPRATEVDRLPTPRDVMAHCLRSLDVSVNATESIEARFQQTLARVSVLVILDNLPDGWPLTDLRPPIPTSLLITSRSRVEYPGITNIRLRPLSMIRARELLVSSVPRAARPISASLRERLKSANADAAAEIAVKETDLAGLIAILCGGLPLAIRAASGVLANLPDMEPEVYVTSLMREQERLKSLNSPGGGPYSVEAAFRVSYDLLNTEEQATFRCMGYFAGRIAKELAATGLGALASKLPELVRRNLVELQPYDSYRMHDLMRLFARKMLSDAERRSIDDRLLQYWRAGAAARYDQMLNSLGQTEWHPNGVRVKLEPTENELASAIAAASGDLERYVPMFTLEGAARFGKTWSEKGVEASRRLGNRVAEALHHLQRGQHAERLKMIRDRTTAPGLRASRITHPAARSALAHYHDGMNALRGCRDRNGVLALGNLLRHKRRMHIILCDQEMVIKVSRIILNLPVRLPQWQVFASFQAIADAFFNRGELSQSEIYAQRALNVADVLELDHLRVHPLNLIGDIELLRGHRSNALIAYTEAENAGTVSSGSEQLSEYWSAGWNLSHELQDRSKVYTFHESYLMRTLLSTPVRKWRDVLDEHLRWYGYRETSPHNSRFDLRVAHAYMVLGDTNTAIRWLDKAVDAGPDFWSFAAATYLPKTWLRGGRPWTPNLRAIALHLRDSIAALGAHDSSPLLDRLASVEAET